MCAASWCGAHAWFASLPHAWLQSRRPPAYVPSAHAPHTHIRAADPHAQGIARWLPATARAHAYRVNAHWRRALAASFEELFIGPRPPAALSGAPEGAWAGYQPLPRRPLGRVFPYATDVQLVVSSSRDTAAEHPEVGACMRVVWFACLCLQRTCVLPGASAAAARVEMQRGPILQGT